MDTAGAVTIIFAGLVITLLIACAMFYALIRRAGDDEQATARQREAARAKAAHERERDELLRKWRQTASEPVAEGGEADGDPERL